MVLSLNSDVIKFSKLWTYVTSCMWKNTIALSDIVSIAIPTHTNMVTICL